MSVIPDRTVRILSHLGFEAIRCRFNPPVQRPRPSSGPDVGKQRVPSEPRRSPWVYALPLTLNPVDPLTPALLLMPHFRVTWRLDRLIRRRSPNLARGPCKGPLQRASLSHLSLGESVDWGTLEGGIRVVRHGGKVREVKQEMQVPRSVDDVVSWGYGPEALRFSDTVPHRESPCSPQTQFAGSPPQRETS